MLDGQSTIPPRREDAETKGAEGPGRGVVRYAGLLAAIVDLTDNVARGPSRLPGGASTTC